MNKNQDPARRVLPPYRRAMRSAALAAFCAAAGPALAAAANADLTVLSLEQLMDLKVVGASKYEQKQSEVAAAVRVVTREEIRAFGWRTIDQLLASLPGVHVSYDRQYTYFGARGFGLPGDYNTRVLVTVNGNRLNDATYDTGPIGRQFPLDLDLVERVEFIPGPGGAVYGHNAMFGVVNVITRDGAAARGTELAASSQGPQRAHEARATWGGRLGDGVDLLLSASAMHSRGEDGYFDYGDTGVAGQARGLDGERSRQLFARATGALWSVDLVHGDRRKDDATGAFLSDPLVPGQYQRDRYTLLHAQRQMELLDGRLQLLGRLFASRYDYRAELSFGTWYGFPSSARSLGGELRALYTGVAGHKLMLGLELQDNRRVDQYILDRGEPGNDRFITSGGSQVGLYAQDEWQLAHGLSLTWGLRLDRGHAPGVEVSPRAGLIWQATPATTVKALYGRAHRAPNAYERNYDDGVTQVANPALRGERIDTLELVADHRVGSDFTLRGAAYRWTMRDLITLGIDASGTAVQYQSGAPVNASGIELSADKSWRWGGRLRASVSLQRVREASGAPLPNSPSRLARLHFWAPLPMAGIRLGWESLFEGPRRTLDGAATGGHVVSNLRLSTERMGPGIELGLTVANLFDKRYAHPASDTNWQDAIEQDGRGLRLDIRLRF